MPPPVPDMFDSDVKSHAELDPRTLVTKVCVNAIFNGITRDEAIVVQQMSQPPNWARALPSFFRQTDAGTFDERAQRFELQPSNAEATSYQLLEVVDFRWAPSAVVGLENVLEIRVLPLHEHDARRALHAFPTVRGTTDGVLPRDAIASRYSYALARCLRTHLLSGWRAGGIDVDEGTFTCVWLPSGQLCIEAVKSLRYCSQVSDTLGVATGLNLLTPSMLSFLMRHLGHGSIHDALAALRHGGVNAARQAPESSVDPVEAWRAGLGQQANIWLEQWRKAVAQPYGLQDFSSAIDRSFNATLRMFEQAVSGKRRS